MEDESKSRSLTLKQKEESKIKYLINSLIETQLNKLDSKLQFLEEYEKLVIYERN